MAAEDEVRTFLHKNNLGQYFESFLEQGYDDFAQILSLSNSFEELDNMMKDVGLFSKPGHKKRFLAAVKIEASKSRHGDGSENEIPSISTSDREGNENNFSECSGNDISKWPKIARDLWIPNPLNAQMKFYNKVLQDLFFSSFDLMAPLQFKDYVLTQRISRWRLKNEIEEQFRKYSALINSEGNNKDGNAMNVAKFGSSQLTTFKPGDLSKARSCQEQIEQGIKNIESQIAVVKRKRSDLFDSNNEVKHYRANELEFLDEQKGVLEDVYNKLKRTHTIIVSNVNVLKRKLDIQQDKEVESKRKKISRKKTEARAVKDKNKRLMLKVEETVKLITNGRLTYTEISQKNTKITLTDICTDCILKPRFHTSALEYLLTNHCFHADVLEFAGNMLTKLKCSLEKESRERLEQKRSAESKKKQKKLFVSYFKQKNIASVQGDT